MQTNPNNPSQRSALNESGARETIRRLGLVLSVSLVVFSLSAQARDGHGRGRGHFRRAENFTTTNLVSDLPGVAQLQDTNLVNAWGVSFGPNTPFWLSGNGSGLSTLYVVTNDAQGSLHASKVPLEVGIPGEGNLTGQVFNNTTGFHSNVFLFASEDGTISGWRGALGTAAEVLTTRTNGVYKGLALVATPSGPRLLAANFGEGTVDAYDTNLQLVAQFTDPRAPSGYAPFNVQTLDGLVFVTFAKQDADKHDDVRGRGHGLIDVLDPVSGHIHRLATGTDAGGRLREINSPWGLALAPSTFGRHAGQLLVGNFGSGTIMAFEADGDFQGLIEAHHHVPVTIEGLWALTFGNGTRAGSSDTLFFTAGPDDEGHGLFGALVPSSDNDAGDDY